ncbi:MAG: T9SS type A sorting domain-containing protein [Bacteroidia bacterium]|nr:T9SS type A sorting domain-containing protein [Bacteroidia bacterium]
MKYLVFLLMLFSITSKTQTYQTGTLTLTFNDPTRTGGFGSGGGPGRQIQTEIYYPAASAGSNVPVATGSFPVIVFGHGFVMSWDSYDNIYKELSQRGYIVALPRTEGGFSPSHSDFGKDLSLVAARMLQLNNTNTLTNLFVGKLNLKSAIGGHSMGGGASFLAAENNNTITCLFNFAAAETNPKATSAAKKVTVPTLILGGKGDCVTPHATNQDLMYDSCASATKFEIILKTLTHCDFSNGNNFNCNFGQNTSGCSATLSIQNAQKRYMNFLNPFLDRLLKDNCTEGQRFMDSLNLSNTIALKKSSGTLTCSTQGLNETNFKVEISLFPNPGNDHVVVQTQSKVVRAMIFSSDGKFTGFPVENEGTSIKFKTDNLNKGMYMISLFLEDGSVKYIRWIKE